MAAQFEKIWRDVDGIYWIRSHWHMIPEETSSYVKGVISNESALEFAKASDDGDDVFLCEYEYDVNWHILKPLAELADGDCENDHVRKEEEEVDGRDEQMDVDDEENVKEKKRFKECKSCEFSSRKVL
ncbi:BnaC02g48720D [Brassica napus]|uniref:BAH domain-containing protein n=2 Tax=Brassica TaxID=3705 RepID=A0A3P6E365_BRAOL|nr:unnamed protein product [Brassica napus]CDY66070.1 BnaC02g48720D [Brassica napus]VDD27082.1 unnamed protein product [Brassica oleracea]